VPSDAAELLDQAMGLWHGPAFAEFADEEFVSTESRRGPSTGATSASSTGSLPWSTGVRLGGRRGSAFHRAPRPRGRCDRRR